MARAVSSSTWLREEWPLISSCEDWVDVWLETPLVVAEPPFMMVAMAVDDEVCRRMVAVPVISNVRVEGCDDAMECRSVMVAVLVSVVES